MELAITTQLVNAAAQRFWAKVDRSGDCWLWTGWKDADGYGHFTLRIGGRNCHVMAHRFSYVLHHGEIQPRMVIGHKCESLCCVNPTHLVATGRSELNEAVVRQILAAMAKPDCPSMRELGAQFGVSHTTIKLIRHGRLWAHIERPDVLYGARQLKGSAHKSAKLTEADIPAIREMAGQGQSQWAIACRFGVNQTTISQILRGKSWSHVS